MCLIFDTFQILLPLQTELSVLGCNRMFRNFLCRDSRESSPQVNERRGNGQDLQEPREGPHKL